MESKKLRNCKRPSKRNINLKNNRESYAAKKDSSVESDEEDFCCNLCDKKFSKKRNLQRHVLNTHREKKNERKFICDNCSKNFSSKSNLSRHISKCIINKSPQPKKINCCICNNFQEIKINLLQHYNDEHNVDISIEKLNFSNFTEFETWKEQMEKDTISKYIRYDSKKSREKTFYYYRCHREGFYKSGGKNMRHIKVLGSNKINGYCPAKIDVTLKKESGEVSINFLKSHVGHEMDLGRIPLTKSDRSSIAEKISQKIPFDELLSSIRNSVQQNKFERIHLLTKKDLYNIKKLFNINNEPVKPTNDFVSVKNWVLKTLENSTDPIVRFYKDKGDPNDRYADLQPDDFLLIIMNDAQLETLKKFGDGCLCIDSITSPNTYDLTTMMVLDDLRQGFPCLFAFSNRSDRSMLRIVFDVLRNIMGGFLKPKVFISDLADAFYFAWYDVMGPVELRLYYSWIVDKVWKDNLKTCIKNSDKQDAIYEVIKSLLEEKDKVTFENMVQKFIYETQGDQELKNFNMYFNTFVINRKSWAYCYRMHSCLNHDAHIERMHKTLNYIYLKGKTGKRLDKAINAMLKFVRDKLYDRLIILNKGKVSTKLSGLRQRHKEMESIINVPVLLENGKWSVTSSKGNETHKVEVANLTCQCQIKCVECNACIHTYLCSCPDSSLKWNMCKHIHLVCQYLVKQPPAPSPPPLLAYDNDSGADNNLPIYDEEDLIFQQLCSQPTTSTSNVEKYKNKLLENFNSILMNVSNLEQCKVIEKALLPLRPTLATFDSTIQIQHFSTSNTLQPIQTIQTIQTIQHN